MTASSAPVSHRSRLREAAQSALFVPLAVALAYFAGAEAAFSVGTLSDRIFAPFWPPNIVLLCALLLVPPRRWWIVFAAALPAHLVAEIGVGMPPGQNAIAFATNGLVAMLNAFGIARFIGGPPRFVSLRQGFLYVLIVVFAGPATAALGGAMVRIAGGGPLDDYWIYWAQWFAANALTGVTLGPLVLTWIGRGVRTPLLTGARLAEAALLLVGLVATCALAFGVDPAKLASGFLPTLFYLPIPFIVWGTVRFGALGASGAILVVAIVSIGLNLQSDSVFTGSDPEHNVMALQVFLIALSVPTLLLGSAIEELQRARSAMQELAGTVLRSQDEERRRISRDLHEKIGQDLTAANLTLVRLERSAPAELRPLVADLGAIMQRATGEVRAVSYLLHPPLLDEAGLALALRTYLGGLARRSGIAFDLALASDLERLPEEVEHVLFRVIQDAVTSVHCHCGSGQTRIALMLGPANGEQTITLTIEDVGEAAQAQAQARIAGPDELAGLGLAAMRERLRRIGGRIKVESLPGRTLVTAVIPIAK